MAAGRSGKGYHLSAASPDAPHVVAIDYGAKDNIFRNLVKAGRARHRAACDGQL